MSERVVSPARAPVSLAHGGAAVLVAATTAVASGDHSIAVALIVAASGVASVVIGPLMSSWLRSRRKPVDHYAEVITEQAHLVEHLVAELSEVRGENERLRRRRAK